MINSYKKPKKQPVSELLAIYNYNQPANSNEKIDFFSLLFKLLIQNIQENNRDEVLSVLQHMEKEKDEIFSPKILLKHLSEDQFYFIFSYCLDFNYKEICDISIDFLFTINQNSRILDQYFFNSEIIEYFFSLSQLNDQDINNKLIQIFSKLSKYYPNDSIIFWDFIKEFSDDICIAEFVSEFIYYEIEFFNKIPNFDFIELFEIIGNIFPKNNQIANGNILMSINKAVNLDLQVFVDFFINEEFIKKLIYQIYNSQLKSVKKEAIILLTSFIKKLDQINEAPYEHTLLRSKYILSLLNYQTTSIAILKYLNSIIQFHPYVFNSESLPVGFDSMSIIYNVMKKCDEKASFKIKIESTLFIANLIMQNILDSFFLIENYAQILSLLLELISTDYDDPIFIIETLMELCHQLLKFGIHLNSIQDCFEDNDAETIFDECLEKNPNLSDNIQSLSNFVFP